MRILPAIKQNPTVHPADSKRIINIDKIAQSLEKANTVLLTTQSIGNAEAIATWERIVAALQHRWRDAQIEVSTNGHYSFYE